MDNIYNEPGASTQQRHLINNTEAELSSGIGTCQEAIATDTGRHVHKDHLGAFKKSALTTELDYVKVSATDDTPGRLDTKVVKKPSSAVTVAVDGTDDHLEIGVDGDETTVETISSKLQLKDGAVTNAKVNAAAAILESKLSLNYSTHSNANDPSSGEKAALAGTSGTPSGTNKYVTNDDVRNTNDRYPTVHSLGGGSHGQDTIANVNALLSDGDMLTTKAAEISALPEKTALVAADLFVIEDSAASNAKKKIQAQNLPNNILSRGAVVYSGGSAIATVNLICWRAPYACTVTNVRGYRVGGTGATVNARRNGSSNHLSSALSLSSADTWMDGGTVQNTAYAEGDKMEIMVVSVSGSPTQIMVQIDLRRL